MAQGAYASTDDLNNRWGPNNIAAWSDLDGDDSPPIYNDARTQDGFNTTDAYIQGRFIDYGNYAYPLQPLGSDIWRVKEWSRTLCGEWLYFNRGLRAVTKGDDADMTGNAIKNAGDQVRREIEEYRARERLNAARRWPTSTCPVSVGGL
jgi:hypothetical protein